MMIEPERQKDDADERVAPGSLRRGDVDKADERPVPQSLPGAYVGRADVRATPRSLRRAYIEWVEEQIEEFKERIPRSHLLALSEEVVNELRLEGREKGYALTEVLHSHAMDRRIFRMLKLPGYRAWCAEHGQSGVEPIPFEKSRHIDAPDVEQLSDKETLLVIADLDAVSPSLVSEFLGALDAYHRAIGGGGLRVRTIETGMEVSGQVAA